MSTSLAEAHQAPSSAGWAEQAIPQWHLQPRSVADIQALPSFHAALKLAETLRGISFERFSREDQERLVLRRLRQLVDICRVNPHWHDRVAPALGAEPVRSIEDFERLPLLDKDEFRNLFTGTRPGLAVPIEAGGFAVAASGGTSSGQPSEIVYPLDELDDTYRWAGRFMGRHIVRRHMQGELPRWVINTLADHDTWSSGMMVGGVLQTIPGINYVGAGALKPETFKRLLAYPGEKAVMGISPTVAALSRHGENLSLEERASLRLALFGSGPLSPRARADLKAVYPNLIILSFFAAMQAETIGLQLDEASPVLTAVPGLHLIEIVDAAGRSVSAGEEGELVVTRLFGNGAPVLRYKLGDRVLRHPELTDERINALRFEYVGRSGDVIQIGDERIHAASLLRHVYAFLRSRGIFDLQAEARDAQIRLENNGRLTLLLATSTPDESSARFERSVEAATLDEACASLFSARGKAVNLPRNLLGISFVGLDSAELWTTAVGKIPLIDARALARTTH